MISRAVEYAIKAITLMAKEPEREYFGVKELGESTGASNTYLGKVLQSLVRFGYLKSNTGPRGGFGLIKDPEQISLWELLVVLDGENVLDNCFMGIIECGNVNPCPIHETWKVCKTQIINRFKTTTISDAMNGSWP